MSAPKGSKAALEAAGWQFQKLPSINRPGEGLPRRYGQRGFLVIPPTGSGLEPQQHEGSGRAIAWAVEQSADLAKNPPIGGVAGMAGLRLMLGVALASGKMCEGPNATPARPDAELLSVCESVLADERNWHALHGRMSAEIRPSGPTESFKAISRAATQVRKTIEDHLGELPSLHPITKEGLLAKARAALCVFSSGYHTSSFRDALAQSLAADLIHLVPTLPMQGCALPSLDDAGEPA